MPDAPRRESRAAGWVGAIWGFAGVALLLGFAIWRLAPLALHALRSSLDTVQIVVLVGFAIFMTIGEGYRGFQKAFSPRVAARCRHLRDHPTALRVALAPLFAMAYFGAPRRRRIASICLTLGVILLVVLVHQLQQPWRGIIDFGVVLGLGWGLVATAIFWVRAVFLDKPSVPPEVLPEVSSQRPDAPAT